LNRTVALLCLFALGSTFSIGAFPVLLPEIARDDAVGDAALGAIAGAFGLARVIADIPAGLFITHHLRRALVLAAVCLFAGVLCLAVGGSLALMLLGRALWGAGHALLMLSGITAIVRHAAVGKQGMALSSFEMSSMFGVLLGMLVAGLLPPHWSWNMSLVIASSPLIAGVLLLPSLLKALPSDSHSDRPLFSRGLSGGASAGGGRRPISHVTLLAFATGCAIALAWSSIGQFVLPLRASRDFELDRIGVALMVALPQVVDVALLLPLGAYADRTSHVKVLGAVLFVYSSAVLAVAFGSLPIALIGCVLFGASLAGWMLPISVLNREGSHGSVAWRTALYRVAVDTGVFLGPVISGLLLSRSMLWIVGASLAALLAVLGAMLLRVHSAGTSNE